MVYGVYLSGGRLVLPDLVLVGVVVAAVCPVVVVVVVDVVLLLRAVVGVASVVRLGCLPGGWGTVKLGAESKDPGTHDGSQDEDEAGGDRHGPAPGGGGVLNVKVLLTGGVLLSTTVWSWSDDDDVGLFSGVDASAALWNPSVSESSGGGGPLPPPPPPPPLLSDGPELLSSSLLLLLSSSSELMSMSGCPGWGAFCCG